MPADAITFRMLKSTWDPRFIDAIKAHYTGSAGPPPGKKMAWEILEDGKHRGWLGLGEPSFKLAPRRRLGLQDARPLPKTVSNFIYRLDSPGKTKASAILKEWHPIASKDWAKRYGFVPEHWETLVDPVEVKSPVAGASFRRAGYRSIGMTTGRSARRPPGHSHGKRVWCDASPKLALYRGPLVRLAKPNPTQDEADLSIYLAAPGKIPGIGSEKGRRVKHGISKFTSPHGSVRYVSSINGVPVAVLQVVTMDGKSAIATNVFTAESHRHQGLASKLLARARKDFASVKFAEHRTTAGAAWVRKMNPMKPSKQTRKQIVEAALKKASGLCSSITEADLVNYIGGTERKIVARVVAQVESLMVDKEFPEFEPLTAAERKSIVKKLFKVAQHEVDISPHLPKNGFYVDEDEDDAEGMRWSNPAKTRPRKSNPAAPNHIQDAMDHMSDVAGRKLQFLGDFDILPVRQVTLGELGKYDDLTSWPEWEQGELVLLNRNELKSEFNSFRGSGFARSAIGWVDAGTVPPIVVLETRDGHQAIGDGRGRTSVAIGMGWDSIPVVFMKEK